MELGVLKTFADQPAEVFTKIFNFSLEQNAVFTCLKLAAVVLVPKKTEVNSLNNCRPVALTPIIAKCF